MIIMFIWAPHKVGDRSILHLLIIYYLISVKLLPVFLYEKYSVILVVHSPISPPRDMLLISLQGRYNVFCLKAE